MTGPAAAIVCALMALASGYVHAAANDKWSFDASFNMYFPSVGLTTTLPGGVTNDVTISTGAIIDHLDMALPASFAARYGRWGAYTDILYMRLSGVRTRAHDFTVGGGRLPAGVRADVDIDLKAALWTVAGTYRVLDGSRATLDAFVGARVMANRVDQGWRLSGDVGSIPLPEQSGSSRVRDSQWDALVGAMGQLPVGDSGRWFVPYYVDVGTGGAKLTWQAIAGVGYRVSWGEVTATWRHIDYSQESSSPVSGVALNGAQLALAYHW